MGHFPVISAQPTPQIIKNLDAHPSINSLDLVRESEYEIIFKAPTRSAAAKAANHGISCGFDVKFKLGKKKQDWYVMLRYRHDAVMMNSGGTLTVVPSHASCNDVMQDGSAQAVPL